MKKTNVALLVIGALAGAAQAQNAASALNHKDDLGVITVTADAVRPDLQEGNRRNPFRTTASSSNHVQVLTRQDIEQFRPADVFEAVNMAGGVVASPSSAKMGFSTLTIRGDKNFRWMIDGAYLDATTAARIMRSIPIAAIEEIKVVRGSSALTLGPMTNTESPAGGAAVDGFIVVRTRKPQKDEGQARVAVESNAGQEQSLWLGKKLKGDDGTNGYLAALAAHSQNGNPSENLPLGQSYNVAKESSKALLKGGIEDAGWNVDVMAYADEGSYQIPNPSNEAVNWKVDPSKTNLLSVNGSRTWSDVHTTLFSVSNLKSEQTVYSTANPSPTNVIDAQHLNIRHNMFYGDSKFMLGADYRHWDVPNGQNPVYYARIPREEETTGWFAQVEKKLLDGRLNLDASYREDSVYVVHGLDFVFSRVGAGTATKTGINDRQLPRARFLSTGGRYELDEKWGVTARYGQSSQPVLPGLATMPGVALAPDAQKKWEVGIDGNLSKSFNPALNYFSRQANNEKIIPYYATNAGTCTVNAAQTLPANNRLTACYDQGDTTRSGLEFTASGVFDARSKYRFSWTHFIKLTGQANFVDLEKITPSDVAELSVSHGLGRYTWNGAVKYVSAYEGIANGVPSGVSNSGYTRYDMGIGYDWTWGVNPVRTSLYGRNLTDKKYETVSGIQDVGRVVGVEMVVGF